MREKRKWKWLLLLLCLLMSLLLVCVCAVAEEEQALPTLVIGGDAYEPYVYFNVDGKPQGLDVELAVEACYRLGYEPVFKTIRWEEKDEKLESGEIDCLWNCFAMTGRAEAYIWAGPYLYSQQVMVVRSDSGITQFSQLKGKRVAVQAGTNTERLLLEGKDVRMPAMGALYTFTTVKEVYAALRRGYVEAIAGDQYAMDSFLATAPEKYICLSETICETPLGVAFQKGTHEELAEELTRVLREMIEDGTAAEIVSHYGLDAEKVFVTGGNDV